MASTAYVSCDSSGKVVAIRTSNWTVERTIDAGRAGGRSGVGQRRADTLARID